MADEDAILIGGPRDGTSFAAEQAGLIELEIDGMVHRYIPSRQRRQTPDGERQVYAYDGMVDPGGALDGAEHARNRQASPLADEGPSHSAQV
jgi:hypothetical protein